MKNNSFRYIEKYVTDKNRKYDLSIFIDDANNKNIGHVYINFFSKQISSKDDIELVELFNTSIGSELYGYTILDNMNSVKSLAPLAKIEYIYVDPEYRNKGIGKIFMNETLENLKKCNKWIFLISFQSDTLYKFYNKFGFINTGFKGYMYLKFI